MIREIGKSLYMFAHNKTKDFEFFPPEMECTDISILCIATAD